MLGAELERPARSQGRQRMENQGWSSLFGLCTRTAYRHLSAVEARQERGDSGLQRRYYGDEPMIIP